MSDGAAITRAWYRDRQLDICERAVPWSHGTIISTPRYSAYHEFNLIRVERDPDMTAAELLAFADEAQAGLSHRRIDFEVADAGERLRAEFVAAGWRAAPLVWMLHAGELPPGPDAEIEVAPYEAVEHLRRAWHEEDFPGYDDTQYQADARAVSLTRDPIVLLARQQGAPVGFAQVERVDGVAEVHSVYVDPGRRGGGLGTALTRAAVEAAAGVEHLLIVADAEGRPKDLYARLGFRPVWHTLELTRWS